jgi:ankyrin repeat protein
VAQQLPSRPHLEWLKKACKERLVAMRAENPEAKLSDAQLAVAREYGFASWRKLKAYVENAREKLAELAPSAPGQPATAAEIAPDDPELTQLVAAVRAGDMALAAQLLTQRPALATAHGPSGQTALHVAGQHNDPRLGLLLLAAGADPNAKFGSSSHTALSWALTCNSQSFAKVMVQLGHQPDLFCAAGMGSVEHVRSYFHESGHLIPGASRTGSSRFGRDGSRLPCPPETAVEQISDALCFACRNGHAPVVEFLLTCEPDLAFRAYAGGTALHWAYFGGNRRVIQVLEAAGADRSARDDELRCTPRAFGICVPANWGFPDMVRRRLAEDPTLLNFMDGQTSPLHEAARGGHADIVSLLLNAGADPMLRDGDAKNPLEVAVESGHDHVVEILRSATRSA